MGLFTCKRTASRCPPVPIPNGGCVGRRPMTPDISQEVGYWDGDGAYLPIVHHVSFAPMCSVPVPESLFSRYRRCSAFRGVRHCCEMSKQISDWRDFHQRPTATKWKITLFLLGLGFLHEPLEMLWPPRAAAAAGTLRRRNELRGASQSNATLP